MLPLVDFVSLLAKDAAGLRMSTCGEVILPDCTLSTFAGFHDNLRILQLQDIALRASFIKGLLSRNQALVMLVLQNVSLIDGTWDDVLRSTGGFHLMEPVFCFIQGLKYARKGDSSMWWVGGVAEGKLYNKRTADHKALKAFEDMLHQNKDQSLQNKDRIMQS
ncbi:hypothetical protein MMC11_002947 [Xylographa trunciseda]|nr:hypothetical protein [Xylographa trunciseda]